jgi:hypothetical protein
MAKHSVHVFCNECGGVHPMGITVDLDDGPAEQGSIGDVYSGKDLPEAIVALISNYTMCPSTGRLFRQKDNNQVFLVAIGD